MPEYQWNQIHQAFVKECPTCDIGYSGGATQQEAERKLSEFFHSDRYTRDGFAGVCKFCVSKRQRANRDGRTCDPDALLAAQDNKCAICTKPISFARVLTKVTAYIDHNHDANKVRGILCVRCNSMLGPKEWILQALAYLEKHGE